MHLVALLSRVRVQYLVVGNSGIVTDQLLITVYSLTHLKRKHRLTAPTHKGKECSTKLRSNVNHHMHICTCEDIYNRNTDELKESYSSKVKHLVFFGVEFGRLLLLHPITNR